MIIFVILGHLCKKVCGLLGLYVMMMLELMCEIRYDNSNCIGFMFVGSLVEFQHGPATVNSIY